MLFRGALIGQLSGSLGGITASNNRGGTYLRSRGMVVNPNTEAQQSARARMTLANVAYSGLSTERKNAWRDYAQELSTQNKLGDDIVLTGQNAFIGSHTSMQEALLTPVLDPPTPNTAPSGVVVSIQNFDAMILELEMGVIGTDNRALLYLSNPIAPGQSAKPSRKRLKGIVAGNDTAGPMEFTPAGLESGQRYGLFTKVVNADGTYSPCVYNSVQSAA